MECCEIVVSFVVGRTVYFVGRGRKAGNVVFSRGGEFVLDRQEQSLTLGVLRGRCCHTGTFGICWENSTALG